MSASDAMEIQALLRARAPYAPDSLRERILALEPRRSVLPSRRLVLVVVPVAVAIAVAAALVHGFLGSSAKTKQPVAVGSGHALEKVPPTARAFAAPTAPSVGNGARLQHTEASLQVHV